MGTIYFTLYSYTFFYPNETILYFLARLFPLMFALGLYLPFLNSVFLFFPSITLDVNQHAYLFVRLLCNSWLLRS
jgi:hypothetical protein